MECKTGISLGKPVRRNYRNTEADTLGFSSLAFDWESVGGDGYFLRSVENMEHFLILHRSHELRTLPSDAGKFATRIGFPNSFPSVDDRDQDDEDEEGYDRLTFLRKPVGQLDPDKEINNLSSEVIARLRKF